MLFYIFFKIGLLHNTFIAYVLEMGKSKFKEDKGLAQSYSAGKCVWTTIILKGHTLS